MHASNDVSHDGTETDFLAGGGDAGMLLRAMDWSRSSLGEPAGWPESLKAAISLLLPSRAQICLFWGPELVAFYNDAYTPSIGANHPAALGRPAREGWSALWDMLEPLLEGVRQTGTPLEQGGYLFPQDRHGFIEDTFFDISYNPIRGAGGQVEGVFCIVSDQTRRITDERRLNTLRVLSLRHGVETAEEAARSFVGVLPGGEQSDTPYALVYLRRQDGTLWLAATHGGIVDAGLGVIPPDAESGEDERARALVRVDRTGQVETLLRRFVIDPPAAAAERVVLLALHAGRDPAGVLVLAKNRRVRPTDDYRRYSELLAAQLSASLSTARVLAEERHRSASLKQQVAAAIAERAEAEAQLRQSQKMEAIGKLTGGVAHDFNNLLQVIGGNLQLLARDLVGNERATRRIGNALEGVARGAKLSNQLLAFSRRQPLEPKVVNVGHLIAGLDDMLRRSLGERVEIATRMADGLWNTLIDPAQMENALLNLAINARDAMDNHGTLVIEAANAQLDAQYADRHSEIEPGDYVMVAVTDTGTGMTPEIVEQVFEPFFSTKPEGKGTGLGLSMVYGFVKQSGGHIKIYSEPGHGTTVRLYLPRTRDAEDRVEETAAGPVQGGTETILVAEDHDGVRETVIAMLAELGYRVLKARDGEGALTVLESGVPVDLLFTDVVMPGAMRGPELAARARQLLPRLAVLFTSGYTENAIVHGGRLDAGVELLSKPYTREALARKLRQVLPSPQGSESQGSESQGSEHQRPEPHAATPAGASPRPAETALRLLLVEDDTLIRENTAELLAGRGHTVVQAASAELALATLETTTIDVLVTDLGLPGINGVDLARRAAARQPKLGLVFATGAETATDSLTGAVAHAVTVRKPYDEIELTRAIQAALRAAAAGSP
ncbi:response regulator [Lichenicola sp.]|uniref:response regulator n=1 Tax=Lichenicola sp. TaxID=2804529 RepID=UPI003B00D461